MSNLFFEKCCIIKSFETKMLIDDCLGGKKKAASQNRVKSLTTVSRRKGDVFFWINI